MKITKSIIAPIIFFIYGSMSSSISGNNKESPSIQKENLTISVDLFIAQLVEAKKIKLEKLPPKLVAELELRRTLILDNLTKKMNTSNRTYVYVSELEKESHEVLYRFLTYAQHMLISLAHRKLIEQVKLLNKNSRNNGQPVTTGIVNG